MTLQGRAYFEVVSGGKFSVVTDKGRVSVLGTKFQVTDRIGQFEVHCYEGKVSVESGESLEILAIGDGMRLGTKELSRIKVIRKIPDWITGYSSFKDQSLSIVINELKKYYEVFDILLD